MIITFFLRSVPEQCLDGPSQLNLPSSLISTFVVRTIIVDDFATFDSTLFFVLSHPLKYNTRTSFPSRVLSSLPM